jgi:hypothetical protein
VQLSQTTVYGGCSAARINEKEKVQDPIPGSLF